jgi:hypothetical protein
MGTTGINCLSSAEKLFCLWAYEKSMCIWCFKIQEKKLADQITTPKDRMGYAEERMRLSLKKRQKLHL